jgi:hypothetical protein
MHEILKALNVKFKLFFYFFSNHTIWHLDCNSFSYMKLIPAKFTFVKLKSRKIFGEFIRFFQKN